MPLNVFWEMLYAIPSWRHAFRSIKHQFQSLRHLHRMTGKIFTADATGREEMLTVGLCLGEKHEAFALIAPSISNILRGSPCPGMRAKDEARIPLIFDHLTQTFSRGELQNPVTSSEIEIHINTVNSDYPRLMIPQDLPRQHDQTRSPATLYCFGATHTIALNGSNDGKNMRLYQILKLILL